MHLLGLKMESKILYFSHDLIPYAIINLNLKLSELRKLLFSRQFHTPWITILKSNAPWAACLIANNSGWFIFSLRHEMFSYNSLLTDTREKYRSPRLYR